MVSKSNLPRQIEHVKSSLFIIFQIKKNLEEILWKVKLSWIVSYLDFRRFLWLFIKWQCTTIMIMRNVYLNGWVSIVHHETTMTNVIFGVVNDSKKFCTGEFWYKRLDVKVTIVEHSLLHRSPWSKSSWPEPK